LLAEHRRASERPDDALLVGLPRALSKLRIVADYAAITFNLRQKLYCAHLGIVQLEVVP
jgi:hypothetical protein